MTRTLVETGDLPLRPHYLLVRSQREQREVLAVEVVHQIEDAGEAGAGVPGLVPGSGFLLRLENVGNAFGDRFAARVLGGEQSHDGPRGLRRRARADALGVGIAVGA